MSDPQLSVRNVNWKIFSFDDGQKNSDGAELGLPLGSSLGVLVGALVVVGAVVVVGIVVGDSVGAELGLPLGSSLVFTRSSVTHPDVNGENVILTSLHSDPMLC